MAKETLPTQKIIALDHIENDALVLKSGGLRKILMVAGVNFDLKSEEEQNLMIFAYQNFLNSLNFSIQQFIHTRKINIDDYLARIEQLKNKEGGELLKNLISEYKEFIGSLVSQNPIMSKTFFVVVPYDFIALPKAGKNIIKKLSGLFNLSAEVGPPASGQPANIDQNHFVQLEQRVEQVITGLLQIGLRAVPLNEQELLELFYNLYNPESIERKKYG